MFSALRASKTWSRQLLMTASRHQTKGKRTEQQEDQDEDEYQFLFT
jgi:hypothetical protein